MVSGKLVDAIVDPRIAATLEAVRAFEPEGERAERAKCGMLELLTTSKAPFSREHDLHHVTASAVVLSDRGVLLHRHKLSGLWLQPGGHVDEGEMPDKTAVRETMEETGIVARHPLTGPVLMSLDVHLTINKHVHYDLEYLMSADGSPPNPPAGESQDVGWFAVEDALAMTDDVCRNLIVTATAQSLR